MSFLHFFGFKNIKVFKDEASFQFAPITVFTGTNSSGKSTVNEAIRLIINQFKKIFVNKVGNLPSVQFIVPLQTDILDERTGVFENVLNSETENKSIEFTFSICLPNYRYKCELLLRYEISGENVKNGILQYLQINDIENQVCIYNLYKDQKQTYFIQVNYLAFFLNYQSIINDIEEAYKLEKNKTTSRKKKEIELKTKVYGKDVDIELPPYAWGRNENNFKHSKLFMNKEWKIVNDSFFKKFKSESIFDSSELFDDKNHEKLNSFIWLLHEKTNIEYKANYSLDYIYLKILSALNFEICTLDEFGKVNIKPLSSNIEKNILSPNGYLFDELRKTYSDQFENGVGKVKGNSFDSLTVMIKNEQYLCENIKITDRGQFFFDQILGKDLFWGINDLFSLAESTYTFNTNLLNSSGRYFDLRNSGFNSKMLSFYAERNIKLNKKLFKFINKWVSEFNLGDGISFETYENHCRIFVEKNNKKYNLSDEGFGFNKILPLILSLGYLSTQNPDKFHDHYKPSVVFIEEPENGLHPALQSKLADFFFDAYSIFNIQFVIETHSEYLIRRLQVLIATDDHPLEPEDIQLYYFYHPLDLPEGQLQYYPINIDEEGALSSNFGTGFFDESSNLNIALYLKSKINSN